MKRRNFIKQSTFTYGSAVLLTGMVNADGQEGGDKTTAKCPDTLKVDDTGTTNGSMKRPWTKYAKYDGNNQNPLTGTENMYYTKDWPKEYSVDSGEPSKDGFATEKSAGVSPMRCDYHDPEAGDAKYDKGWKDGSVEGGEGVLDAAVPDGYEPIRDSKNVSPHGEATKTGTIGWSRDITYQTHGTCS